MKKIQSEFLRIFFAYMAKYFLAFSLIFATSIAIFQMAKSNMKSYILERAQNQVEAGVQTLQDNIEKLELLTQMVYRSGNFELLTQREENISGKNALQLRDSQDLLVHLDAMTGYADYIFVLFKNNELYLSTDQPSLSFSEYYDSFLSVSLEGKELTDAANVKNHLFEHFRNGQKFLRLETLTYSRNDLVQLEEPLIYLTDGIATHQSYFQLFGLVFSKEQLVHTILQELEEDGFVYIQDITSGRELLSYGSIPSEVYPVLEQQTASVAETDYAAEYHTWEILQKKLGWRVVAGLPISYVNEQIASAQLLLVICLFLGFAATIGLALYFSLTRYYGFRNVLSVLSDEEELPPDGNGLNDYKLLTYHAKNLGRKKESYRIQSDELQRQNRALFLENLITRGQGTEQERQTFIEHFGQEPEFFCVVMMHFQQQPTDDRNIVILEMSDILMQKGLSIQGHVQSGISNELFLLVLPPTHESSTFGIMQIFEAAADVISQKYHCILHIGISTVGTGLSNISKCYEQVKQIVQAQYLYVSENVVQTYADTSTLLHENPITTEFLSRLHTLLVCGRYNDTKTELRQVEGYFLRMPYLYEARKAQIFYSLENVFYTVMLQLNCPAINEHLPQYSSTSKCEEMFLDFQNSAAWIYNYVSQGKSDKNRKLKDTILKILNENYQNPDLSILSISEMAGISEKYLYQFWKEQTGETVYAQLLRIRIDKAKEYLVQSDYSNAEIAALTGFASVNTFYRNFQKQTGTSPKTYKEKDNT